MKCDFNVNDNFLCNVDVENISSHKLYRDNGVEFLGVGIEIYADLYINVDEANKYIVTIKSNERFSITNDKVKLMMVYIHEHFAEKISIPELAAAAFLSERECFRIFHDCLHMTPVEYMKNYRLQAACQMLAKGQEPVTSISHACGLGSSSYFGKVFREYMGCTPMEYRCKWQNNDI